MRNLLRQLTHRFNRLPVAPIFFLAGAIAVAALASLSVDAQAARVTYEYDDGGRLKKTTYPNSSVTEYKLDAAGNRTNIVVLPPDTTPPSSPGAVSFSSVTTNSMTVNWGAATDNRGVAGYDYQVNGGAWQSLGNVLTVGLTGLSLSTSYTVRVRARDAAGNVSATPSSNTVTTASTDTIAPSVPAGLNATAVSSQQINLSWSPSIDTGGSGLAGYRIYRDGAQISTTTSVSYSDTGLTPNRSYGYTVAAYDNANNSSLQSSQVSAITHGIPATPSWTGWSLGCVSSICTTNSNFTLSWTATTGVTAYEVLLLVSGTDMGGNPLNIQITVYSGSATSTVRSSSEAAHGNGVSYAVRACNASGCSGYSAAARVIYMDNIAPSVPTGLSAIITTPTQVSLSWTASTDTGGAGVTGYRIYRNGSQIGTGSGTSFIDNGFSLSAGHTYTVAAYDGSNNSSGQSAAATPTESSAPTAPTGLGATAVSAAQVNLSWGASTDSGSGVASYRLYRNSSLLVSLSAGATSYQDTSVVANTAYAYYVVAVDGVGNPSVASNTASVTTPMAIPATPSWTGWSSGCFGPSFCHVSADFTLSWTPTNGSTSYEVLYTFSFTDMGGGYHTIQQTVYSGSSPSTTRSGGEAHMGNPVSYAVRACNAVGCSAYSASVQVLYW